MVDRPGLVLPRSYLAPRDGLGQETNRCLLKFLSQISPLFSPPVHMLFWLSRAFRHYSINYNFNSLRAPLRATLGTEAT
ncbi:MAG: hypothetical protein ACD_2C00014G0011 [uncultured bacterium (gcode 4)]|uniref:Uncharacterized protein n=1 Tax=uncultured bacterium (gcode 4) TaxID=1234023 RepID=K2G7E4_9BACT|nr:MAG: hypothetical protein ACD_2C00014G0011 [uncultured bacterium (gcode 4)]